MIDTAEDQSGVSTAITGIWLDGMKEYGGDGTWENLLRLYAEMCFDVTNVITSEACGVAIAILLDQISGYVTSEYTNRHSSTRLLLLCCRYDREVSLMLKLIMSWHGPARSTPPPTATHLSNHPMS